MQVKCRLGIHPLAYLALILSSFSAYADEPLCIVSLSGDKRLDFFTIEVGGKLSLKSKTPVDFRPGTSTFDATGRNLYVGGSDPEVISVFRVSGSRLTLQQTVTAPAKPSFLKVTPSGRFLLASYFQTGQVTVHRILGEGRISDEPLQTLQTDPRAHGIAVDPSERFVFVPHTSVSRISQFRFDAKAGKLSPNTPAFVQQENGGGCPICC